jgi:hypothetical protein
MTDRFDLEQQIFYCWHITDDIKVLTEEMLDRGMSIDEVSNVLIGLEKLYTIKFDKLFRIFETCIGRKVFDVEEIDT